MADITCFGLGLMGSALAGALLRGGHDVAVWNRSAAKVQPLVDLGAIHAKTVSDGIAASAILLVCIDNYETTRNLFGADHSKLLRGKTVVQLSTGTPKEAREAEVRFRAQGADYLDGAILAGPSAIGLATTKLLYAGQRTVFERCQKLLLSLGGDTRFVGEKVGSASALDLAWLSEVYGTFAGAAHGVTICRAEGVDLAHYSAVFPEDNSGRYLIDVVRSDNYGDPGARLSVWNAALTRIREQATDSAISSEVPDFVASILDRAEAEGYGDEHIAAMVKVLGRPG